MPTYTEDQVLEWLGKIAEGWALSDMEDNEGLAQAAIVLISEPVVILPPGYLSPNFTIEELTYSDTAHAYGLDNTPNAAAAEQLSLLANNTLEKIRDICLGYPVCISSGYRGPEVNAMVGGAEGSAHLLGCAADFTIPEFGTPIEVCKAIEPFMVELEIDQLIHENDSWVHVGRTASGAPRHECLTINGSSCVVGIV
jgi:zinc D-Ala-D-Ala carboxypeptidase